MTQFSNTTALPRRSAKRVGSFGALALVVAVGAAVAGGIALTSNDAPAPAFESAATAQASSLSYPITVDDLVRHGVIAAPLETSAANLRYPMTVEDLVKNGIIAAPFEDPAVTDSREGPR